MVIVVDMWNRAWLYTRSYTEWTGESAAILLRDGEQSSAGVAEGTPAIVWLGPHRLRRQARASHEGLGWPVAKWTNGRGHPQTSERHPQEPGCVKSIAAYINQKKGSRTVPRVCFFRGPREGSRRITALESTARTPVTRNWTGRTMSAAGRGGLRLADAGGRPFDTNFARAFRSRARRLF